MTEYISNSPEDTEAFAERLASNLKGGEVIAFRGGLGMGKTCFTRGLARGLEYTGQVISPTFALMNEYLGGRLNLYHFDMYRITGWEDLYSSGYFDYIENGGIVVAEWSENIDAALEDNAIIVEISLIDDNSRKITVKGIDI